MEEGDDVEESRGIGSNNGTPKPDGGLTPIHPSQQGSGALSPRPPGQDRAANSRGVSPLRQELVRTEAQTPLPETEDADMADEGEVDESVPEQIHQENGEQSEVQETTTNHDRGKDQSQRDQMDTT